MSMVAIILGEVVDIRDDDFRLLRSLQRLQSVGLIENGSGLISHDQSEPVVTSLGARFLREAKSNAL